MATLLLASAVTLALVNAASLLGKAESFRGLGRIAGGLAWMLMGAFLLLLSSGSYNLPPTTGSLCAVLILAGFVTVGSGVRKYIRRNLS